MHIWQHHEIDAVEIAVREAGEGVPTVLMVEGAAGTGKTSLLGEVAARATDFEMLEAVGMEGLQPPYSCVQQWGVGDAGDPEQRKIPPFVAAQWLRARLDDVPRGRPVLVMIDDIQWADTESVEALIWLLRRARGDRLLVGAASRPLGVDQQTEWQRFVRGTRNVTSIRLTGLTPEGVLQLVRSYWPDAGLDNVQALWSHTDGNPLYLTALLEEYDVRALTLSRHLPAPSQYRQLTRRRSSRLTDPEQTVIQAAAVLGDGWWPLAVVGEVAGVADPAAAAQSGLDAGLLEVNTLDGVLSARCPHALTRAAVYDNTPLAERRKLHLRAAETVTDPDSAIEHRIAVSDRHDDGLAAELEHRARILHNEGTHRAAATYWHRASTLSADADDRRRRQLEELFDRVQNGDEVAAELTRLAPFRSPTDAAQVIAVQGLDHMLAGRWREAVSLLSVVDLAEVQDALIRYRCTVLLAFAQANTGDDTPQLLEVLERAQQIGVSDPALDGMVFYGRSIVAAHSTSPETLANLIPAMPAAAAAVPLQDSLTLSWRGNLAVYRGHFADGIRDLREVVARLYGRGMVVDPSRGGGHHSQLGLAYWMSGQWSLARLWIRLARDVSMGQLVAIVRAYPPMLAAAAGEFEQADRDIADIITNLLECPWSEAVQALLVLRVVRLHAAGAPAERRSLLPEMRRLWPTVTLDQGLVSAPWLMHATLAALWSDDLDCAERWIDRMADLDEPAAWVRPAVSWLRGLAAEHRGDAATAVELLRHGVSDDFSLPFYRAHAQVDLARVARARGSEEEAALASAAALRIYESLGADSYVTRLRSDSDATPVRDGIGPLTTAGLSEREQDVVTLLLSGLSYQQIARELFVTRSTVNYHLGNIYAKAGVRSRHELVAMTRTHPVSVLPT